MRNKTIYIAAIIILSLVILYLLLNKGTLDNRNNKDTHSTKENSPEVVKKPKQPETDGQNANKPLYEDKPKSEIGNFNKNNALTKKVLSMQDISIIKTCMEKFQAFPGPSDRDVKQMGMLLLKSNLSKPRIQELLGDPTNTYKTKDKTMCFCYDIGDSRRIELVFNEDEELILIKGVGVGFEKLQKD